MAVKPIRKPQAETTWTPWARMTRGLYPAMDIDHIPLDRNGNPIMLVEATHMAFPPPSRAAQMKLLGMTWDRIQRSRHGPLYRRLAVALDVPALLVLYHDADSTLFVRWIEPEGDAWRAFKDIWEWRAWVRRMSYPQAK